MELTVKNDRTIKKGTVKIIHGDNLDVLRSFSDGEFNLIYIDPPFNTGKIQNRKTIKVHQDSAGDRIGFGDKKYKTEHIGDIGYSDIFDDYLEFLRPRLEESYRVLAPNGALCFHIDQRESHYCKVMLDKIFGRKSFLNEIIWSYDYGARSKKRWSAKHDTIFIYVKDPKNYVFNFDAMDRIPYMAPGLVGEAKAKRGKTPTDSWFHTIVSPNSKEKTGYPTQKPIGVLNRFIKIHSNPGDKVLDFFAGSGSFGDSAIRNGRHAVLVDEKIEAIDIMNKRFGI